MSKTEIDAAISGMDGKKSKYGVDQSARGKEDRTADGITFHSKHEMRVWLDYVKPNVAIGVFTNLHFQVPFDLHAISPGGFKVKVGKYIADFVATSREGKTVIVEAKGHSTPLWKRNRRHFEAEYGLRIMEL